jgi:outer membrane protein assembly factor BamB
VIRYRIIILLCLLTIAADWPQFHGPRRDNISTETGLLKQWPEGGPKLLWQADGLGEGWSSVAIKDGRLYTAGEIGSNTVITALDLAGKRLWQINNGTASRCPYPGGRATPTIDGDRLYHLNCGGDVLCADARTGKSLWTLNIAARIPRWGLAESLLVDGNNLICTPGSETAMMVALDKRNGKTVWTTPATGDKPAYTAPILVQRQIVTMTSGSAIGVDADTGKQLWRYEQKVPYEANISHPIYHEGHVVISSTWGVGTTMLKLTPTGVEKVWHTTEFDNEHGGFVLVDGHLYGLADGNHKHRHWACLDWKTGKTMWAGDSIPGLRSATTSYADGMLYLMTEKGVVMLAHANPQKFDIVSQFELPKQGKGPYWAHLVICGGRLHVRHGQFLYVYDIRK